MMFWGNIWDGYKVYKLCPSQPTYQDWSARLYGIKDAKSVGDMESNEYLYWYGDDEKGQGGTENDSADGGEKKSEDGNPTALGTPDGNGGPSVPHLDDPSKKRRTILMTTRTFPT